MNRFLLLFSVILLPLACDPGTESGFAPIARLTLNPLYLPAGENAEIVLDARNSCDELDHPEACDSDPDGPGPGSACPGGITFSWDIPFDYSTVASTPNGAQLRIATRISSPQPITLTVTDCDGLKSSVTRVVGVTVN
ncbi:hypothetical protein KJ975_02705 [Myxococcota bacterium]|nr:hypothetical protein [Myxococcota bacterium]